MNNFENEYLEYIKSLSMVHINGLSSINNQYQKLISSAEIIYSSIENRKEWIKNELVSVITRQSVLNFSENFSQIYIDSFFRYELIEDFISKSFKKYDIIEELKLNFRYYYDNDKYLAVKISSMFFQFSIKQDSTFGLIEEVCKILELFEDVRDATVINDIYSYINDNFQPEEINFFHNQYSIFSDL